MKNRLRKFYDFLIGRLQETSTVRGLVGAGVLVVGYNVEPSRLDAWTTLAVFVSAALKVILPDRWGEGSKKGAP